MAVEPPDGLILSRLPTPIGVALLVTDAADHIRAFDWADYEPRMRRLLRLHYGPAAVLQSGSAPSAIALALEGYFAGDLTRIDALPTATAGTTFQRAVWAALRQIPVGETTSYGALAARIGAPKAVRAVGLANGANPVGLIVPCHRVIGASGALTGYGGGLERKRWLLAHEAGRRRETAHRSSILSA
jgi:methylated-DNA-[protein]-cysteine S-methyltransferase